MEIMMENSCSFCISHEFRSETEKPAGRDRKLKPGIALRLKHILHDPAAGAKVLDNNAGKFIRHVDNNMFNRLTQHIGDALVNDFRRGDLELVSFPTHCLNQNSQMQFAPSTDFENVRAIR